MFIYVMFAMCCFFVISGQAKKEKIKAGFWNLCGMSLLWPIIIFMYILDEEGEKK